MKVLVFTTMVPFVRGGAEELCDHLVRNLRLTPGVEAEAMRLPFTWDPAEGLVDEMLIARSLEIINVDRLIPLKFPAYLARHPNKVLWLLHQYRQAYDLYDAGQSNIGPDARGPQLLLITETPTEWRVRQIFDDPAGDHDFGISAVVDLAASDEAGTAVVRVTEVGAVRGPL